MRQVNPRYVDIAIDIASKIKKRTLKEGDKLRGRSIASADYNVSAETIRKSFNLLQENKIIEVKEKSGAHVVSRNNAIVFLNNYRHIDRIQESISNMEQLMKDQKSLSVSIQKQMKVTKSQLLNVRQEIPIEFVTFQLHTGFDIIGKSIKEVDIYGNTGATLFGIVTKQGVISNVDPAYIFQESDILYLSCGEEKTTILYQFLKK
jgi:K+/H+ antiporter YhaU regulatory subunit KhtT